ncbi:MAG: hypothetical protein JWN72_521 [Thermoleophilia bacterium]|nr:hypothetical protein [Thermoleophilia bacterium]
MTSPYSSNLLQHSDDDTVVTDARTSEYPYAPHVGGERTERIEHAEYTEHTELRQPRPQAYAAAPQQQVVRYAPQQAPVQYAPQPQPIYVQAAPAKRAGGAVTGLALALVVILVGAVALIGGYFATKSSSPSALEANTTVGVASDTAFIQGRDRGTAAGREAAAQVGETRARLTAALARENAFNKAYTQGMNAGNKLPRSTGYRGYSGYRGNGIRYSGPTEVQSAIGYAQNLANVTGAPVDVEIY